MDNLIQMTELYLGKNKIAKIENLFPLSNLRILALMSNRLIKIEGLEELKNLQELYLSGNAITKLEGLENNVSVIFFMLK